MDRNKELFSTERLEDILKSSANQSSQEINLNIYGQLKNYMNEEPQFDDITMVSLKYLGT
jgi:serine phosphatase RsbU (regulator of sigma subunit)